MSRLKKYDNKTIEEDAVDAVASLLRRTGLVDTAQLLRNDKTLSWDGPLFLHSAIPFSAANLSGEIPTQVKGTYVTRFSDTFPFSIADLRNYYRGRGVMLFVVKFRSRDDFCIYYRSLLPFDLRQILSGVGNQKTKSIKLEVLSGRSEQEILQILSAFLENRDAQGTLPDGIGTLSDLQAAPFQIKHMSFVAPSIGIKTRGDAFNYFLSHPQYVYATPVGIDSKFPVDIITLTKIADTRKAAVTINGEVIFERITVVHRPHEEMVIYLSPCLSFPLSSQNQISFQIDNKGTLDDQIASLTFLVALLEKQDVRVNERPLTFSGVRFDSSNYDEMKARLEWLLDVRNTLKLLHVKKTLNMEMVNATQSDYLAALVDAILYKKPVSLSGDGNSIGRLSIGNITVALLLQEKAEGTYISDAYQITNTTISCPIEGGGEVNFPGSVYTVLPADILLRDDNIDFEHMVDAIIAFPYSEHYATNIIFFVLELIHAYDRSNIPNDQFLDIALKLYKYLLKNDNSSDMMILCYVNSLQVVKRRRSLTTAENQYLLSLKNAFDTPLPFRLAAAILLESFNEANLLFEQLDETTQKEFAGFPICHLWPSKATQSEDT